MKNTIRDFFYFPKDDRRAVVALGCIAAFCVGVLIVTDALRGKGNVSAKDEYAVSASVDNHEKKDKPLADRMLSFSPFDPNTVDSLTFVQYGIAPWKIKNFLHYRAAGKVFHSAEDIGNTYGWTAEDVELLAPYVRIATKHEKGAGNGRREIITRTAHMKSPKFQMLTKVDANTADSATLCSIPGIGGGISSAILRYRARLGGFNSTQQLLDISIVSSELLAWFTVYDTFPLTKIAINKASFQVLNAHPYITYDQTRNLLRYIRLYGNIDSEQTLLSTGIFTAEEVERLRPYIQYD